MRRGTALPVGVTRAAEDGTRAGVDWAWPVPGPLQDVLPSGALRRGTAVAVRGSTSLLFATISAASIAGAWIALVGMPNAGMVAAAEHGISVDRLALIPYPGADWPQVVAALVDGVDLVVAQPAESVDPAVARRLAARVRQRGAVLLSTQPFPGAEATLQVTDVRWCGLGAGRGRLRSRQVTVAAHGPGRLAVVTCPRPEHGLSLAKDIELVRAAILYADEIELVSLGSVMIAGIVRLAGDESTVRAMLPGLYELPSLDNETIRGLESDPEIQDHLRRILPYDIGLQLDITVLRRLPGGDKFDEASSYSRGCYTAAWTRSLLSRVRRRRTCSFGLTGTSCYPPSRRGS